MKKILLAISFLLFASCTEYTVKVEADDVNINGDKVENGDCVTYKKAFFGWFGDALTVTVGEKETSYEEGHYVVGEEITEVKEACEEEVVVATDTTVGGGEGEEGEGEGEGTPNPEELLITAKKDADEALKVAEQVKKAADGALKVAEDEKKVVKKKLDNAKKEALTYPHDETIKAVYRETALNYAEEIKKVNQAKRAVQDAIEKVNQAKKAVQDAADKVAKEEEK